MRVCVCFNVFVWSCVLYRVMLCCVVCFVCGCCLICLCGLFVVSRALLSGVRGVVMLRVLCVACVCGFKIKYLSAMIVLYCVMVHGLDCDWLCVVVWFGL